MTDGVILHSGANYGVAFQVVPHFAATCFFIFPGTRARHVAALCFTVCIARMLREIAMPAKTYQRFAAAAHFFCCRPFLGIAFRWGSHLLARGF